MDWLQTLLDVALHLDQHLNEWATALGPWLYVLLFAVVFCETGLVVTPFLPGDSLLFAVGAICAIEGSPLSVWLVMALLIAAAVLGDASNYAIGNYLGPRVFTSDHSRFLNRQHLLRTQQFYLKYGSKTIVLARFVPIVRTFAPFVAGIGRMPYATFATWNVLGGVLWVVLLTLAGYFFGRTPFVQRNFETVVLAIIAISIMPMAFEWWRARRVAPSGA
jgi:membrane-associated protein